MDINIIQNLIDTFHNEIGQRPTHAIMNNETYLILMSILAGYFKNPKKVSDPLFQVLGLEVLICDAIPYDSIKLALILK